MVEIGSPSIWNHIFTIVAESQYKPYWNDCSIDLYRAGILLSHRVEPSDLNYPEFEDEVREYLKTNGFSYVNIGL